MILVSCATLAGFVTNSDPWPSAGTGGFAEWGPIYDVRLQALNDRLEAARSRGAETYAAAHMRTRCFSSSVAGASWLQELTIEAGSDLARLEQQVAAIEATLSLKGVANRRLS